MTHALTLLINHILQMYRNISLQGTLFVYLDILISRQKQNITVVGTVLKNYVMS